MEVVELIWEEIKKDPDGFESPVIHAVKAYAQEKSVTRSEKYQSMNAGVSVETVFEVRQEGWEETRHTVNGKPEYARKIKAGEWKYDIIRAYKIGKSKIEVVCG